MKNIILVLTGLMITSAVTFEAQAKNYNSSKDLALAGIKGNGTSIASCKVKNGSNPTPACSTYTSPTTCNAVSACEWK